MTRLLDWWRARRARARAAVMLRAESEMMLDVAHQMRGMSDDLFAQADAQPQGSAEHWRLSFEAHALACASLAWDSKAGGDDETAAMHMDVAEWWVRKAQQYDMRALLAQEDAAHA